MSDEFIPLLKKLNVSLLSAEAITELHSLERQWRQWEARERQYAPPRVEEERQAAYIAFLDNPTPENEQKLLITADANLTAVRYSHVRRAFADLRTQISVQASEIIRPVLRHALEALTAEYERRLETAEPVMSSRKRNPLVIEARRAIDIGDSIGGRLLHARSSRSDLSPLQLAERLLTAQEEA